MFYIVIDLDCYYERVNTHPNVFFFFLFYLIQTYKPLTKNGQVTLIGKGVEEEKKFCSLKLTARKVQGIVQLNQKIGTYDDSQPKLKDFYFSFQNSIKPFPMDNC